MGESKNDSTVRWLWFTAVLLGWPALLQTFSFAGFFLAPGFDPYVSLAVAAVLATVLAWFGSRFAFAHGAPRFLWVAVALGSAPYITLAVLAALGASQLLGGLLILGATLLPTIVVAWRAPNKRFQRMADAEMISGSGAVHR